MIRHEDAHVLAADQVPPEVEDARARALRPSASGFGARACGHQRGVLL